MPTNQNNARQPGDDIIDRYLPDATLEERERARLELKGFAVAIFGVAVPVEQGRQSTPCPIHVSEPIGPANPR